MIHSGPVHQPELIKKKLIFLSQANLLTEAATSGSQENTAVYATV
jgi:hypothetical protein